MENRDVEKFAKKCRFDILDMTFKKKAGFIGSDYSCIDILSCLYLNHFNYDTDDFVMSKGHAAAAWYTVLANLGKIEHEKLNDFNTSGKNLGVHPKRGSIPDIKTSTGSLGQGFGLASGMALAERIKKGNGRVYALLGDGEANEGSVWEIVMFAAKHQLDNFIMVLDRNHLQSYGFDKDVLDVGDFKSKLCAFGWDVISIDGHNINQINTAFNFAKKQDSKPHAIIAETVKGKGVSEMENEVIWHYKWPDDELYRKAMQELGL